jgi:hypothetical protein
MRCDRNAHAVKKYEYMCPNSRKMAVQFRNHVTRMKEPSNGNVSAEITVPNLPISRQEYYTKHPTNSTTERRTMSHHSLAESSTKIADVGKSV